MAIKTLMTVEEFTPLLEKDDEWYELVEGEVVRVSPGMFEHNRIRDKLLIALAAFAEASKLGVAVAEQPFHLFRNTVRHPDVAFVRAGKEIPPRALPKGGPDLAVEVVSPSNTPREMDQKVSDYFGAGSKRVWLVYPEHREVYVYGLSGVKRLRRDDALEDAELLPGFSVRVSSLFE